MSEMTIEEAKKMQGTEFLYVFPWDGDSVPAFVKKFDEKVGLTCMSLRDVTAYGHKLEPLEADGTCCLIAYNFRDPDNQSFGQISDALEALRMIRDNGQYICGSVGCSGLGNPSCAF